MSSIPFWRPKTVVDITYCILWVQGHISKLSQKSLTWLLWKLFWGTRDDPKGGRSEILNNVPSTLFRCQIAKARIEAIEGFRNETGPKPKIARTMSLETSDKLANSLKERNSTTLTNRSCGTLRSCDIFRQTGCFTLQCCGAGNARLA